MREYRSEAKVARSMDIGGSAWLRPLGVQP
jgi:hypothetical protein